MSQLPKESLVACLKKLSEFQKESEETNTSSTEVNFVYFIYEGRKKRRFHPVGFFDAGGRWYPDKTEFCFCCERIRSPSRRFPYSLLTHCRSKAHVTNMVRKLLAEDWTSELFLLMDENITIHPLIHHKEVYP